MVNLLAFASASKRLLEVILLYLFAGAQEVVVDPTKGNLDDPERLHLDVGWDSEADQDSVSAPALVLVSVLVFLQPLSFSNVVKRKCGQHKQAD